MNPTHHSTRATDRLRRRLCLALLLLLHAWFLLVAVCRCPAQEADDPCRAAVRVRSHGGSGTVIHSRRGRSLILSCAHMFETAAALRRPLQLDGPPQPDAPPEPASVRLLALDPAADLSLLELDNGPFYAVPVAPAGHRPGPRLLSVGYDDMRWPVTCRPATLLSSSATTTFTRERPWHGRSGGGLIDANAHRLIGVVQGYEVNGRGLYVSHAAVLRFLAGVPQGRELLGPAGEQKQRFYPRTPAPAGAPPGL